MASEILTRISNSNKQNGTAGEVHGQQARMIACGTEAKAIVDNQLGDPMQMRKGFDGSTTPVKSTTSRPNKTPRCRPAHGPENSGWQRVGGIRWLDGGDLGERSREPATASSRSEGAGRRAGTRHGRLEAGQQNTGREEQGASQDACRGGQRREEQPASRELRALGLDTGERARRGELGHGRGELEQARSELDAANREGAS
jgi:hypothetical protein